MAQSPFRVLMINGRFAVRGSSAQALSLVENLPKFGFEPTILCYDASRIAKERRRRLPVVEIPQLEWSFVGRVLRGWLLSDLLVRPPDLIHIQGRAVHSLGQWLARKMKRPYILTVYDFLRPREALRLDPVYGRRIIAVSHAVADELLEQTALRQEQVTVVHSGVAIPPEDGNTIEVLDPGHTPVVGTAGPLEAAKGFNYFLQAARKVLDAYPKTEFLIAGAGPEEKSLRQLARELGILTHVTFLPNVYDFADALSAMDIFCLPSLRQGLGTIMLEAMARGRPVIATQAGGIGGIIDDGKTGLFVPPTDDEALARRIVELLENPERARAIGQAARGVVAERFRLDTMLRQTTTVYHEVLDEYLALSGVPGPEKGKPSQPPRRTASPPEPARAERSPDAAAD